MLLPLCSNAVRLGKRAGDANDPTEARQETGAGRLLLTGCGQQCIPQPVGPGLTGRANGSRHFPSLTRSQADLEHMAQKLLLRQTRPPEFFCHRLLTNIDFSCTESPVFIIKTASCQKDARTSPARLADQGHPVAPGAGEERLAMRAERNQVRSLKIERTGDFWRGTVKPQIRLVGYWLARAGFQPGNGVEVRCEQPGTLSLRFVEQPKEATL